MMPHLGLSNWIVKLPLLRLEKIEGGACLKVKLRNSVLNMLGAGCLIDIQWRCQVGN